MARLPPHLQSLVTDLLYHLELSEPLLLKALAAAVLQEDLIPEASIALRGVEAALTPRWPKADAATEGAHHPSHLSHLSSSHSHEEKVEKAEGAGNEMLVEDESAELCFEAQASLAVTLLFAQPPARLSPSLPTAQEEEKLWQRHKALADRVCLSLLQRNPFNVNLAQKLSSASESVMPAVQALILAGGVHGLTSARQLYGLIRLCTAMSQEAQRALIPSSEVIPSEVVSVLPQACLAFFSMRLKAQPPLMLGASVSQQAEHAAQLEHALSEITDVILSLVKALPSLLLLPLIQHAAQAGVSPSSSSSSLGGGKDHSEACTLSAFTSSIEILIKVLQCKPLLPTLLDNKAASAARAPGAGAGGGGVSSLILPLTSRCKALVEKMGHEKGKDGDSLSSSLSIKANHLKQGAVKLEQLMKDVGL